MKPIQETFLETDWDDEASARAARDARATELQAQGLVCSCENLYNVMGYRVFLLEATEMDTIDPTRKIPVPGSAASVTEQKPVPRQGKLLKRKTLEYETR
jgi:hypothetical protein